MKSFGFGFGDSVRERNPLIATVTALDVVPLNVLADNEPFHHRDKLLVQHNHVYEFWRSAALCLFGGIGLSMHNPDLLSPPLNLATVALLCLMWLYPCPSG